MPPKVSYANIMVKPDFRQGMIDGLQNAFSQVFGNQLPSFGVTAFDQVIWPGFQNAIAESINKGVEFPKDSFFSVSPDAKYGAYAPPSVGNFYVGIERPKSTNQNVGSSGRIMQMIAEDQKDSK